jgi:hypothetical protein
LTYVQPMLHIAIVSSERHWAKQVEAIFPEWEMKVEHFESPSTVLLGNVVGWNVIVLDLDSVEAHTSDVGEFITMAASRARHTIVLIPPHLMELEAKLTGTGIFVLRKPTSSGEIALAMRMLFRDI